MPFVLNSPFRRGVPPLRWLVLLAGFALPIPAIRAQVVFQKEVEGMAGHPPFLHVSNAPFDLSDPLYDSTTTHKPWVVSSQSYYMIDPENAVASTPSLLPPSVKLTTDSHVSFAGRNTSKLTIFVLGYRKTLYRVKFPGEGAFKVPVMDGPLDGVSVPVAQISSMAAADSTHLTMIADGWFQTINIDTGDVTRIFSLDGGTGPGQFSNDESAGADRGTRFHTYGPNGLLYVLDHGNDRMQILDPGNAFAYVSEFSLESGVTTENMSFAIGVNGNIYLGDGEGGGSTYSAMGVFLGAFTPSITPSPGLGGAGGSPFIDTDAAGNIYVYDDIGGYPGLSQFQYRDMSVVPEPAEIAAVTSLGLLALAAVRRRRARTPRR